MVNATSYTDEAIDLLLNQKVSLEGHQTISGIKTFEYTPIIPSSAPLTDGQAANKKYVDDSIDVIQSILDGQAPIYKVANTTERGALASALSPSTNNPLFVWRVDAPSYRKLEYTTDNVTWGYLLSSRDPLVTMTQRGFADISVAGLAPQTAGVSQAVTFPEPFPGTPTVVAQLTGSNWGASVSIWGTNSTGFSMTPRNNQTAASFSGSLRFNWIATY